jgi:hypothetical protein
MAGIAIPDNLRPTLAAVAKYHFWILAALVPLVLVPLLFMGTGSLRGRIADQRRQIESKLGQASSVTAVQPHPNESWQQAIDADAQAASDETLVEWRRFWHSQRWLRQWPTELGAEFLANVATLKPGGQLERPSLIRYREVAPRLVQALPRLMGVASGMGDATDGKEAAVVDPALAPPLSWNPANQKSIEDSFVWEAVPNTTQVLLAQEELWVYGMFCRLLADFVKSGGATGAHDSPLTVVNELAVGFPAKAGSAQARDQGRIVLPKIAAGAVPEGEIPADVPSGGEASGGQPWHPRFTGANSGRRAEGGTPDDDYRGWIYVDFSGKPLSAAELAADPAMRMVHLMPFVLRVTVDQRQFDRLLTTLAAAPVPIDVRQVRVNPGAGVGDTAGGQATGRSGPRANDIVVEVRGTVALAVEPTEAPAAADQGATP